MKQSAGMTVGTLFVVATPIGNLGDISPRAVETLKRVDRVAAEDTRRTGALLSHLGIRRPMVSLHSHNESGQVEGLLARLVAGESIALVSDAGTPLISDPGFPLIRAARRAGLVVVPLPGPSAVVTALSVSGLPCERFCFEGFLPARAKARRARMQSLAGESRTLVFYESPHRIADFVEDAGVCLGADRPVFVARELTKLHEEGFFGTLGEAATWLAEDDNHRRGEFVVVVGGAARDSGDLVDEDRLLRALLKVLSVKDASRVAAEVLDRPRKQLYQRLLALDDAK